MKQFDRCENCDLVGCHGNTHGSFGLGSCGKADWGRLERERI